MYQWPNLKLIAGGCIAMTLVMAGCGRSPISANPEESPAPTPSEEPTPPTGKEPNPPPNDLTSLKQDVQKAYAAVMAVEADYDTKQFKGKQVYTAKVHMIFAKPRRLRLDIRQSSDALLNGAIVVWLGGSTLKGRKDIGPFPIRQEHKLTEKPNLRGWYYNQTDYEAMAQSFLANVDNAKLLGTTKVDGRGVAIVEFRAKLPGAAIERVGVDLSLKLPVFREMRETPGGQPIFSATYKGLTVNPKLAPSAFEI